MALPHDLPIVRHHASRLPRFERLSGAGAPHTTRIEKIGTVANWFGGDDLRALAEPSTTVLEGPELQLELAISPPHVLDLTVTRHGLTYEVDSCEEYANQYTQHAFVINGQPLSNRGPMEVVLRRSEGPMSGGVAGAVAALLIDFTPDNQPKDQQRLVVFDGAQGCWMSPERSPDSNNELDSALQMMARLTRPDTFI